MDVHSPALLFLPLLLSRFFSWQVILARKVIWQVVVVVVCFLGREPTVCGMASQEGEQTGNSRAESGGTLLVLSHFFFSVTAETRRSFFSLSSFSSTLRIDCKVWNLIKRIKSALPSTPLYNMVNIWITMCGAWPSGPLRSAGWWTHSIYSHVSCVLGICTSMFTAITIRCWNK